MARGPGALSVEGCCGTQPPRRSEAVIAAVLADDQMIMEREVQHVRGGFQTHRQRDVVFARRGIARRVIVGDRLVRRQKCQFAIYEGELG